MASPSQTGSKVRVEMMNSLAITAPRARDAVDEPLVAGPRLTDELGDDPEEQGAGQQDQPAADSHGDGKLHGFHPPFDHLLARRAIR